MKAQKAVGKLIVGGLAGSLVLGLRGDVLRAAGAGEQNSSVAVSVGTVIAEAGVPFTVPVTLDKLPETGISAMDFAIAYDPAVMTVSHVTLQYDTGADAAEAAVSPELAGTVFQWKDTGSEILIRWATALDDPDYWLREAQEFFTVSGTVHADAAPGSHSALRIVPASWDIPADPAGDGGIVAGYMDRDGNAHSCETELTNGHVWTLVDETGAVMYGDMNLNGELEIADAVMLFRAVTEDLALSAMAYANADCEFDSVLSIADVTLMLRVLDGQNEAAVLGAH
jgi:hypothetical protein